MIATIVMMAAHSPVPLSTQIMGDVFVTRVSAGACSLSVASPPAAVRVTWIATGFDSSIHAFKVYENDVLRVATTALLYDKTVTGKVEGGPYRQATSDWVYRVDLVRVNDATVLATASSAPWAKVYGSCNAGLPEPE